MIKTTGKEWLEFLSDPKVWVGETYMDDTVIKINGLPDQHDDDKIKPDDVIVVEEGVLFINADMEQCRSLEGTFRKWKKTQTTETLLVEIPQGKSSDLKTFLKSIKGKIIN